MKRNTGWKKWQQQTQISFDFVSSTSHSVGNCRYFMPSCHCHSSQQFCMHEKKVIWANNEGLGELNKMWRIKSWKWISKVMNSLSLALPVSSTQLLYKNFTSEIEKQLNFHSSENLRDSIFFLYCCLREQTMRNAMESENCCRFSYFTCRRRCCLSWRYHWWWLQLSLFFFLHDDK